MYVVALCLSTALSGAQQLQPGVLSFDEYLGYMKKYHPLVRQANLEVTAAQAGLMTARGAFDPKIEIDFDKKEFKGTEYYSLLNSSFKIPTWYGIEVKAGFDNSEGMYVNPQNTTPNSGLTSLGVTIPLAQGLFIDRRMADLRTARGQLKLSESQRRLRATGVVSDASIAYFNWKKAFDEVLLYTTYLNFAETRYSGLIKLIQAGDKPAIDSIEAGITVRNRKLGLSEAQLKLVKARMELSNYIWINDTPVELAEGIIPEEGIERTVAERLGVAAAPDLSFPIEDHPKITALKSKIDILEVERQYRANLLLPRLDLSYNYLSEPSYFDNYRFEDYKIGLNFSLPLFLRKERGGLQLAKLKIQDSRLDLDLERVAIKNKITAHQAEIQSILEQQEILEDLVNDYTAMLEAEERLFAFGESSLFLINTRENSLVSARLSRIAMQNRMLVAYAELFRTLAAVN
jgi:outer membrane protein TolC